MEYQEALTIGRKRRHDAYLALSFHMQEKAVEVCAVKPAKGAGVDAQDWEPVGEEKFKEICLTVSLSGAREARLLVVDGEGVAKACTQKSYPLPILVQMAYAMQLPVYRGPNSKLLAAMQEGSAREDKAVVHIPSA